jgi:malonyl-CoA/methylmalonyl-CoA synthetase
VTTSEHDQPTAWRAHGFDGVPNDLLVETTLVNGWRQRWATSPDHHVLHDDRHGWVKGREMELRTADAAARFVRAGLNVGDRVLMSCQPSVQLVIAHVGALRAGCIVVPVNTAFTAHELANIARESGARLVVIDDAERLVDTSVSTTAPSLARLEPADPQDAAEAVRRTNALRADDPALLVFTSGTTGRPKGALLSHGNLLASAQALCIAWGWTTEDRLVLALPLFHIHGLGVGVHCTLLAGASAVIVPKFTPENVLDAARDHRATLLFGVPTMWVRILDAPRAIELASLRLCVSGSAALAPDVWNGLRDRIGQEIVERYGMTETVINISNPLHGERRPGSVGLPLPGVEVRLDGAGADGVGEIVLRGPNVFAGYWERPDANAEAFTADGWFRSGDLGRFDLDGYVAIVGRSKDLIISGGYNVYPRDVEEVLREHSMIADVAVVGEPSAEWGETVTACVVAASGTDVDPDAVLAFAADHLAGYQRPRRIVVVDEFPRNALGKVVKAELLAAISTAH